MLHYVVKLSIILQVISVSSSSINKFNKVTRSAQTQDESDRWIWGYADAIVPVKKSQLIKQAAANPCDQVLPPKPNYTAPGKTLAEQKCEEYLWEVRNRLNKKKKEEACDKYNKDNNISIFKIQEIGGREALPGEFPHMGAIGWKAVAGSWIFKCGSSLISSKFVLTAAHCTKADARDTDVADVIPKIVRFGDKNIIDSKDVYVVESKSPVDGEISRIIIHPNYKSPKKYNDIALMELTQDLILKKHVQPACLWHQFDTKPLGAKATSTGWGVVQANSRDISPTLQVTDLDIIDSKTCDALLRPNCNRLWCGIQDTQICAGKLSGGVDACQGDSGGPLQVRIPLPSSEEGAMHYVIGVTSFGFGCALKNTPGVYTRVSPYVEWIENHVWK